MNLGVLVQSFWYYKKLIVNNKATPAEKSAVIWAILFLGKYMVLKACQHVLENHDKPVSRHTAACSNSHSQIKLGLSVPLEEKILPKHYHQCVDETPK